ncbi:hypothetical protein [Massilia antarctica]|uniref:hypothetical protein n=1 Tax=Massilia antarctica TaxID=2765360 RepID=UPI0006BB5429|nr:hypothetical protein [Massilia sp. H27-R4]MCY0912649.1 hypothetical protein [Massilia sp. H27-R4]CUI03712.1 hypothetical protein BN2497_2201 [Janthinobacterium sp. CG23_2]CUU27498.1 hypothetical protein BN3177_2201 [Janthinobacterium sp. CG23_2]
MPIRACVLVMLAVLYGGQQCAQASPGARGASLPHPKKAKDTMQQPEKKILLDLETFRSRHDIKALSSAIAQMLRIEDVIAPVPPAAPAKDKFDLWLCIFDAIDSELAPDIDTTTRAQMSVAPPPETGLPAGAAPDAIKDPVQRAAYEAALAANQERNQRISYQHKLRTEEEFAEDSLLDLVKVASASQLDDLKNRVARSVLRAPRKARLVALLTPPVP